MGQRIVMMPVAVVGSGRDRPSMIVLVMPVMLVFMLVIDGRVRVGVDVMLGKVKPHTQAHESHRHAQVPRDRVLKQDDRQNGAGERRRGEIRTRSGRSQIT